jgi:hypothetical protein
VDACEVVLILAVILLESFLQAYKQINKAEAISNSCFVFIFGLG